jgi:toxin ParE1/3/4
MPRCYQVIWTPAAQKDLEAATLFISKENPQAAAKVFRSIRLKAALLYRFPLRGRLIPELAHIPGLPFRELVLKPWRLLYRIKEERVEVLAFFDGRRDLSEVLFERLSRMT